MYIDLYMVAMKLMCQKHFNYYEASKKYIDLLEKNGNVGQDVSQDIDSLIIEKIKKNNKINMKEIAKELGLSERTINRHVKNTNSARIDRH